MLLRSIALRILFLLLVSPTLRADPPEWIASKNLDGRARVAPERIVPGRPNVLIIGDSISIDYTETVRTQLAGFANVYRVADNCQDSTKGARELERWLATGGVRDWAVIHFNFGLHDIKRRTGTPASMPYAEFPCTRSADDYRRNLEAMATILRRTGAKLIWASTTPSPPEEVRPPRRNSDVIAYNRIAADVMHRRDIVIDDLYAVALPRLRDIQIPANVHFEKAGSVFLGEAVAREIRSALTPTGTPHD